MLAGLGRLLTQARRPTQKFLARVAVYWRLSCLYNPPVSDRAHCAQIQVKADGQQRVTRTGEREVFAISALRAKIEGHDQ